MRLSEYIAIYEGIVDVFEVYLDDKFPTEDDPGAIMIAKEITKGTVVEVIRAIPAALMITGLTYVLKKK